MGHKVDYWKLVTDAVQVLEKIMTKNFVLERKYLEPYTGIEGKSVYIVNKDEMIEFINNGKEGIKIVKTSDVADTMKDKMLHIVLKIEIMQRDLDGLLDSIEQDDDENIVKYLENILVNNPKNFRFLKKQCAEISKRSKYWRNNICCLD